MLNLIDEQKRMFYTSGYSNNYILTFMDTDLVITNETIHSETPVIKESICDAEDFTLGGCIASSMEFEVSEILADEITGLEYTAHIEVKNEDGEVALMVPMGVFRVDQSQLVDDKDYKKVTAYDRMYDISEDVAVWYNEYFSGDATHTVKETRESLLTYLGIPFVVQTLTNDDVTLEKTIETTSIAGTDVLRALCVINGGFGHMNREGKFEVIGLTGLGLFPEDSQGEDGNLYPSETLYPEDYFEYLGMSDNENACPEYRICKYEEYMTAPITCLNIQSTTDDVGVTVGDDLSNPYVITANFFLYGKSQEKLAEIGQNILGNIKGVTYRPNTTELDGLPYLECGDVFALEKKNDSVESYIFSRTLSGIQALKDTYEAKGNYIRANEVSANDEIIQLKGKSLEIKKSVEGLSSEVKDFENNTASKFEQTDEAISAEVKRATEAEGELSSAIEVTAESITAEVKRATEAEGELSSNIQQTAREIVLKVDENGNIVEVGLTADPEEGTKFTVTAKNIELTADEVISLLTEGTINLSGKKISIESENFTVSHEGNVQAKSIEITGGSINIETSYDSDDCVEFNYKEDLGKGFYNLVKTLMNSDGISYSKTIPAEGTPYTSEIKFGPAGSSTVNVGLSICNATGESSEIYLSVHESGSSFGWICDGRLINVSIEVEGTPEPKDAAGLGLSALAVDATSGKLYIFLITGWKYTGKVAERISLLDETCWRTEDSIMANRFIGDLLGNVKGDVYGNLLGIAEFAECDANGFNISENYLRKDNIGTIQNGSSSNSLPSSLDVWNTVGSVSLPEDTVYIVFGQGNFASNPNSGTRCLRIVYDGEEYSRSQVVTEYYCALQTFAIIESYGGSVHIQAQQNCGNTITCTGLIHAIRIK